jgi:hypothetical protein
VHDVKACGIDNKTCEINSIVGKRIKLVSTYSSILPNCPCRITLYTEEGDNYLIEAKSKREGLKTVEYLKVTKVEP